ncbi:hypothetical protein N7492_008819 [Penicillium capsulatum]|uniref:Uncharacterized protein n=1 Tax=Penicillium capsulatum TaxID=69766 RepID=A0A9W9HRE4_9EURO|nr:hypothetical protein N7492_008819 [Penicillium capsulatum]KAJ6106220.1 hypothetical protein N7512_009737 [Penicillium capsulatum]
MLLLRLYIATIPWTTLVGMAADQLDLIILVDAANEFLDETPPTALTLVREDNGKEVRDAQGDVAMEYRQCSARKCCLQSASR